MAINLRFRSFEWVLDEEDLSKFDLITKGQKAKDGALNALCSSRALGAFKALSTNYVHIVQILRLPRWKIMRNKRKVDGHSVKLLDDGTWKSISVS